MKKNILLILIMLFLVTGCGNNAKLSGNLVKLKGVKITTNEYYDSIKKDHIQELVNMIDHKLFDEKYAESDAENEYVENQISTIKKNYANNDDETFEKIIPQYFGVNTKEELEQNIHLDYKRNLAVNDFIEDNLKDKEIEAYYEANIFGEMKASHILIKSNATADSTSEEKANAEKKALKQAKEIISKLKSGESFEKLAKKYSEDDATRSNGGDLGYFELDTMVEPFSNALKDLKVDEYTKEPVKTQYGYHIILKTGEKEKPSLDDSKSKIKALLRNEKLEADPKLHYQTLIDIRKDKKIKWNDSTMKKAYDDLMNELLENAKSNNN